MRVKQKPNRMMKCDDKTTIHVAAKKRKKRVTLFHMLEVFSESKSEQPLTSRKVIARFR